MNNKEHNMSCTRRNFLASSSAALWMAGGCRHMAGNGGLTVDGIRIGVQMWSVDELWKADPAESFRRLRALGYVGVQSLGFYSMNWEKA